MRNPALMLTFDESCPSCVRRDRLVAVVTTLVMVLLMVFGGATATRAAAPSVDEPAPDFVLKSSDGHNRRLSEYRGDVVIVNFWSKNCGPCRQQLAWLSTIDTQNRISILSINIDRDRDSDAVMRRIEDQGIEYPVLFDTDKSVIRLYDPSKLPMAVIVDQHGSVRYLHNGYKDGDGVLYAQQIAELLAE